MTERRQLEEAISALERSRKIIGDATVDQALASLRERLAALDNAATTVNDSAMQPATLHAGERRVVTILFCDVKGSTAMAEQFDPEEWAGIMQRALEYLTAPIYRHFGTLAQVMGDGILAFFGAPFAHEDDPQKAVFAGLEILEGIRNFREQLQRERGLEFNVRVGIHTGLVVVGGMGKGEQGRYTAVGDTVNVAARMEQTAQPGTMQISEQTYRFIGQIFECESLGEIKVKGKREPVRTYRVVGLKAAPGRTRGLEQQGVSSPMVGRDAEFATLKECVEHLSGGQGGIIGIIGEAGIGKSRLIEETYRSIPEERYFWLEGHTLSFGQAISYWPFQEIVRQYAGISDQDGEDKAWSKLADKIATLFPENTAEILPYLASLLALPVKGDYLERVQYLDGEALGRQIFLAARRFFERLARIRPVVLVFEDLHWIDESSAELLEHLLPLVEDVPLLFLGISRPDQQTHAAHLSEMISKKYAAHYTEIRLTSLSRSESAELVHNLLKIDDLPERVHQMIMNKADGNPFFVEEILRALIDLGAFHYDPTRALWRVTETIENIAIPDTVQGVILARLDRLDEGVKQVLRVASVIGRSFLYRVLEAVSDGEKRLEEHLAELQNLELIQEKQRLPELEYIFKHTLVQEATYESILLETRRELHARVGQTMELLFADRLEGLFGLLAHHYAKAEAWGQAQAYLLKAADQAGQMAADAEALAHYEQARAAYDRAFGAVWDPVERSSLERKIGEAFYRRGEYSQALEYFRRALAYLGHPFPTSRRGVRTALLLEIAQEIKRRLMPGRFPTSDLILTSAPTQMAAEEEMAIYQAMGYAVGVSDHELFLLLSFRMLNLTEKSILPVGAVIANAGLGIAFSYLNLLRFSDYYDHRAMRLAKQLKRPDALGYGYTGLMTLEILRDNWDSAIEYGQLAAEAFRKIGNLGAWSVSIRYIVVISLWRGDFARALVDGQEMTKVGLDSGDRQVWSAGLVSQGSAEYRLGRFGQAVSHLEQAIELTEAAGNNYLRVLAVNELGQSYLRQGQWQTALGILESNYRFILEHNFGRAPHANAILRNGLATAYLLAAEQSHLRDRHSWLKMAGRACRVALKWAKSFRPGKPEALRLQGRYEWLKGNAEARRWWQMSLVEAKTLGMRYELGQTHLEIGQRLGEHAHLKKAQAIFTELETEHDFTRSSDKVNSRTL